MHDPKEEEFLQQVRRLAEIGYGRMMQIIAYEWSEKHPERAMIKAGHARLDDFFDAKRCDPLAQHWRRFGK